jgi:hypothetical protein
LSFIITNLIYLIGECAAGRILQKIDRFLSTPNSDLRGLSLLRQCAPGEMNKFQNVATEAQEIWAAALAGAI